MVYFYGRKDKIFIRLYSFLVMSEDNFCISDGNKIFEPAHDKTNEMACVPIEDSDQPGHPLGLCCDLNG